VLAILEGLQAEYGEQYRPHSLLKHLVASGLGFSDLENNQT
jgi:hypothetical protein